MSRGQHPHIPWVHVVHGTSHPRDVCSPRDITHGMGVVHSMCPRDVQCVPRDMTHGMGVVHGMCGESTLQLDVKSVSTGYICVLYWTHLLHREQHITYCGQHQLHPVDNTQNTSRGTHTVDYTKSTSRGKHYCHPRCIPTGCKQPTVS